jgi:hypothetical protein
MSFRVVAFYLGCAAAWLILLPAFVIGGGIALSLYAVCSELSEFLSGVRKTPDATNAREIARRMCLGH